MLPKGLLREHSEVLAMVIRIMDVIAIVAAGIFSYALKFQQWSFYQDRQYLLALGVAATLTLVIFSFLQIYQSSRTQSYWQHLSKLVQAILVMMMVLAGLAFLTKTGENFSRSWFVLWGACSIILLVLFRFCLLIILRIMRTKGWNERCVIIMGAGKLGAELAERVQQKMWTGFRIVAFFDDFSQEKPKEIAGIPVLRTPANLSDYILNSKKTIDEIWLSLPLRAETRVKEILYELRHHTLAIRFALDIFGLDLLNHSMTDLAGYPTLNLNASPMVGFNRVVKAVEDRVLAAFILLIVSPFLVLIALGVKLSSKGPILFKQQRHGWDGRIINVYKFRTMYVHQEKIGQITQAKLADPRVTRFGRFLRKTSLDELPQFINVLQGKMSIVGPRPHALAHNEFYKDSIKAYMQRHKVKPGITGWAQVNGWRGETQALDMMKKRVEYDLYYIENWSLILDLKIIFLTVFRGFVDKNAY